MVRLTRPNADRRLRTEVAADARRLEIDLFWRRSIFFAGFLTLAGGGFLATLGPSPEIALVIASFGLICSLCWTLGNRGSKYWYEAWEAKIERQPAVADLFSKREPAKPTGYFGACRWSVSRLAILLSDFSVSVWLLAGASTAVQLLRHSLLDDQIPRGLYVVTWSAYVVAAITTIFCEGRLRQRSFAGMVVRAEEREGFREYTLEAEGSSTVTLATDNPRLDEALAKSLKNQCAVDVRYCQVRFHGARRNAITAATQRSPQSNSS